MARGGVGGLLRALGGLVIGMERGGRDSNVYVRACVYVCVVGEGCSLQAKSENLTEQQEHIFSISYEQDAAGYTPKEYRMAA